ncbi:hypothetical protein VSH64_25085 [Amycolatopsis rhabdoformis]|uniref:DNA-binding protein n=1 Tax=Amycolatopsis rhabdoformis TaxID=1448059 RepID=A0ABZ1HXQ0_9PSEU|nr:hypothetical protein [Amycolatopsis rhabdoformis]WSE26153.1 hypothetical protein VSH64_25085 [Amycolatopsis rhabdoformis]
MNTTYSIAEVVAMFGSESDWWLREGVRQRRYPHLKVGRSARFTDEHVAEIRRQLEVPVVEQKPAPDVDVSVLGATARSTTRHRNRRAS